MFNGICKGEYQIQSIGYTERFVWIGDVFDVDYCFRFVRVHKTTAGQFMDFTVIQCFENKVIRNL